MLLPPSLEEKIPAGHLVRVVDRMIEELDLSVLERQYKGGGTSAYHPKMMLKVIVYAYTQQTFSSRKIAKELRENVNYMWLSGMSLPNHRTINRFRGEVLKAVIDDVFYGIVEQLLEAGYVDLESYFVDGTKIEANANRYSYVWKKSTKRYQENLQKRVRDLLEEIDDIEAAENEKYGDKDLPEVGEGKHIDSQKLKEAAERINQRLREKQAEKDKEKEKKFKKAKKKLEEDYIPRTEKYEYQLRTLGKRNSYSKTDEDATFLRMKEDHLGTGQPKPGYNIQMGTQNQFVMGYSIHQKAGDTTCLKPHMEHIKEWLGKYPETLTADAGYGSEENYACLRENNIVSFVKYNTFHLEQKRNFKEKKKYRPENFTYWPEEDQYECPQGKRLRYLHTQEYVTANGYQSERRVYGDAPCQDCSFVSECAPYSKKKQRRLAISVELVKMKKEARERLTSPMGKEMRSQRPIEVEAVFGRLKHNWGFRRFMLRGLEKVNTEWGILCLAHNIAKVAAQ
jgi:transposase